jgi:hypothetical protein
MSLCSVAYDNVFGGVCHCVLLYGNALCFVWQRVLCCLEVYEIKFCGVLENVLYYIACIALCYAVYDIVLVLYDIMTVLLGV